MEKPSFKLVGAPCGHHGQYTFYKALRLTGPTEKILAIGDFFFVRIWQDSELVSIGELQLLWTDRVSDQTLVSLRLYFLPENTPDGRGLHGEDEVLAINDKVVLRAEDLLSWMCTGQDWTYGLKAVWRGACAPHGDARPTAPLHGTQLDFSDVDKEKNAIDVDAESPGVVVFSYPRYCRYRALLSRLEGIQAAWLRDSLVAALGGYSAPTKNTRILYCKDTFEYPELEGHEFVCNHLAPKLKGRPRGRRRRPPRSRTHSPESRSSEDERPPPPVTHHPTPRRLSLRNGLEKRSSDSDPDRETNVTEEDKAFLRMLRHFHRDKGLSFTQALSLKHLSLRALYTLVVSRGGYEAVCRLRLWRALFQSQHSSTRAVYERFLLPLENHERRNGVKPNGITVIDTDTITVCDSPPPHAHRDSETGEVKEDINVTSKRAEELNREFLDSLPKEEKPLKITVKPVEKLIDTEKRESGFEKRDNAFEKRDIGAEKRDIGTEKREFEKEDRKEGFLSELANKLNLGNSDTTFLQELARQSSAPPPPTAPHTPAPHPHAHSEQKSSRPVGRSSLRAVRVKPARAHTAPNTAPNTPPVPPLRPDSASSSPPSLPPTTAPVTNFGIHHPPPQHNNSDDEIVEVPYKPKTPEIIDLDEYPESPQAVKKKKLDILKERGLEVTPLPAPAWPAPVLATPLIAPSPMLLPAVQHQIMTNAQLFQMYNIIPQNFNGMQPPKVIQATPLYGTTSPEKTVYGNPKDPFMPPPHVLHGVPIKPTKSVLQAPTPAQDILDLTCKLSTKPAVEIVRVPTTPSPSKNQSIAQNLTKNYSIVDGKAVVGSNLEITLVNKAQPLSPLKKQTPQKRSSNGKFTKTPTPPKDYPKPYKKNPIIVPNYQVPREDSPTSSTSSQNSQKNLIPTDPKGPATSYLDPSKGHVSSFLDPSKGPVASYLDPSKGPVSPYLDPSKGPVSPYLDPSKGPVASFLDPSKGPVASFLDPSKGPVSSFLDPYMALYNLAGQMDPRQLAAYREIMANPFRYSGLLNMGVGNPTTKN